MESLLIRADASTQMGTGHLMRCLALGQAWKDAGGEVIFITTCQNGGLLQRLRQEGFSLHTLAAPYPDHADWDYTKEILTTHPTAWLVLDGYHFDEVYQQQAKQTGHKLLLIDDMAHLKHYYADIVLNQNLHAEQLNYNCEPNIKLLLGTKYALLRREFLTYKNQPRTVPEAAKRVLVTMGGSDSNNVTLIVIQAFREIDIPGLEAVVVVGAGNPYADMLEAAAGQSPVPISIVHNVKNMPQLMAEADAAISAAGSTIWELAYMGVPMVVVATTLVEEAAVTLMKKQWPFSIIGWRKGLFTTKLIDNTRELIADRKARCNMIEVGKSLVDGQGARRVREELYVIK